MSLDERLRRRFGAQTNGIYAHVKVPSCTEVYRSEDAPVLRWRVTEASGRVLFVYATTRDEAEHRVTRQLRDGLHAGVRFEVAPLEDEVVTMVGREAPAR